MKRLLKITAFLLAMFPAFAQASSYDWSFETADASFYMRACCPGGNTCKWFFFSGTFMSCSEQGNARVHSSDGATSFQVYPSSCESTSNRTRITVRLDQDTGNYSYTTGCY